MSYYLCPKCGKQFWAEPIEGEFVECEKCGEQFAPLKAGSEK